MTTAIIPLANAKLVKLLIPKARLHGLHHGGHLGLVSRQPSATPVVDAFLAAPLLEPRVVMTGTAVTDGDFCLIEDPRYGNRELLAQTRSSWRSRFSR